MNVGTTLIFPGTKINKYIVLGFHYLVILVHRKLNLFSRLIKSDKTDQLTIHFLNYCCNNKSSAAHSLETLYGLNTTGTTHTYAITFIIRQDEFPLLFLQIKSLAKWVIHACK